MRKTVIGVMGPGETATQKDVENAYKLGVLIAKNGWVLLSGGRNEGVMDAVNKGAKAKGGLTMGILPTDDTTTFSDAVDIAIVTNMGGARNYINVLSSDVIIACGIGPGTTSEIALAIKARKPIIMLNNNKVSKIFFKSIGKDVIHIVNSPEEAIKLTKKIFK